MQSAAPLLLGVALDELLEDVAADERKRLLLEVLRLALVDAACGLGLLALDDLRLGLGRACGCPTSCEKVFMLNGRLYSSSVVDGHGAVHVVVELGELVDVVPDRAQSEVWKMCAP